MKYTELHCFPVLYNNLIDTLDKKKEKCRINSEEIKTVTYSHLIHVCVCGVGGVEKMKC